MTSSVHKFFSKAEKHLKSGNLAAAEVIYQQILAKFRKNATAEIRHKPSNLIKR